MPKLKTKSALKRRLRVTASGKVKRSSAFKSHFMRHKSQDTKRKIRRSHYLASGQAHFIKRWMPYGL